jgi:hypothetical protein
MLGRTVLPDSVLWAGAYVDDIGMLCPDEATAIEARQAMLEAAQASPSGDFVLRRGGHEDVTPASQGFTFLGYDFRANQGRLIAQPKPSKLAACEARLEARFDFGKPTPFLDAAENFRRAYRHWTGGDAWLMDQVARTL